MKRGVITLDILEVYSIVERFPFNNYSTRPITDKLAAAVEAGKDSVQIEVSEDEVELILDEIGIPSKEDSDDLKSGRQKLNQILLDFNKAP